MIKLQIKKLLFAILFITKDYLFLFDINEEYFLISLNQQKETHNI